MRILIADPNENSMRQASQRLSLISGITFLRGATDLTETFNVVEHRPPSVVLLENSLTKHAGFEMMETLFRCLSVRWLTYQSTNPQSRCGKKTNVVAHDRFVDLSADLITVLSKLRGMNTPSNKPIPTAQSGLFHTPQKVKSRRIVLIGSSTGGVDALLKILGSFPVDCPPTIVVQHTGASFSAGLARMLNQRVEPVVQEAIDGETPSQGTVLIAPSIDKHLVLDTRKGIKCRLDSKPKIRGHRPSVDALFQSAMPLGPRAICVILTGMGKDGGAGLLEMRKAGAYTIGQDKATSTVFGMPGFAAKLGAVAKSLPIQSIGPSILQAQLRAS
jgi:two-component system chemotaxis response regulator CheB